MIDFRTGDDRRAADLRAALTNDLATRGHLRSARWRRAFETVPRHVMVPRFLLDQQHDGRYITIDGGDPDQRQEWLRLVYTDEPLVTHLDGDAWVSSSSQPSLMARMLESLSMGGLERVLEIGTGTGYNAALLCEGLVNSEQVVSVDIDVDLVQAARPRLAALGYEPTLATVDGAGGYPDAAPYDRIIATCSLPRVPVQWLDQTAEGGLILLNLHRDLGGGALALLRVEDGRASGHFLPFFGGFMPTRTIKPVSGPELLAAYHADGDEGPDRHRIEHPTALTRTVLGDPAFGMVAGLQVDAHRVDVRPDSGPEQIWLLGGGGSWAYQTDGLGGGPMAVQDGPDGLWSQLEAAYEDWSALGRPAREEYGLTVTADGDHIMWHGSPGGPSKRLSLRES